LFDSKGNGKFLKAIGECMGKICALLLLGTCYENMELGCASSGDSLLEHRIDYCMRKTSTYPVNHTEYVHDNEDDG